MRRRESELIYVTEDPRDYGLTAEDLRAAADRLYDSDDPRLEPMTGASERFARIRSRIRGLADAIEHQAAPRL